MRLESRIAADSTVGEAVDLSTCAKEPIHTPGMIQSHGLLLVLGSEGDGLVVRQASANWHELADVSPADLVGRPIEELLGPEQSAQLRRARSGDDLARANPLKFRLPDRPGARAFNVLTHDVGAELVLEAEPVLDGDVGNFQVFYHELRRATARLQDTQSEAALCQVATDEVRGIIGYDRVMLYRFDADWNGVVVAESRADGIDTSYLGLHFPASDIPAQARRLFAVNRLRYLPDVGYAPARLHTGTAAAAAPLDMSRCVLRSVSPIHLEYLRNMGVGATLTVSLSRNGVLWGLIACHHSRPKQICTERRLTTSFLGQIFESQLAARQDGSERAYRMQTSAIQVRFLDLLARGGSLSGLAVDPTSVLDFVDAQGAAIVQGMRCTLLGRTPDRTEIPGLIDSMTAALDGGVFSTDSLAASYPAAERFKDVASGMLGVEVSRERGDYLLWFRPEQARMFNWAGNPDKPVIVEDGAARLHPRKSFELWRRAVTLHSTPWSPGEVAAAGELNETLRTLMAGEAALRARRLRQDAVAELGGRALASTDTRALFRDTVGLVARTLEVEICRVLRTPADGGAMAVEADLAPPDVTDASPGRGGQDDPLALFAASSRCPVVADDLRTEARFDGRRLSDLLGAVSGIAVPIDDSDRTFGVIVAYAHRARRFEREDVEFLKLIASVLSTAVRRKGAEEQLEYQSQHDGLTGLPNRALVMDRLAQTVRNVQSPPSLLLIDLDRFKEVNDTLGHHFGDLLLKQVAGRFRDVLRTIDTLARLGGDEFVVLLPRTCERDALVVAQRMLAALKSPFELEDKTCDVGASIGIAIAPRHGDDADTLMRRADVAMYVAKRSGGGLAVYSADQDDYSPAQLDLASDLRATIGAGELVLHYQPKLNLHSRRPEGVEALARWFHPKFGMIPPSRFIPMAEHAGLMSDLGRWALDEAVEQRRRWCAGGLALGVAVNLSPRMLHEKALYQSIVQRLGGMELPLTWLTLEITESALMQDPRGAIDVLTRLRGDLGLKVSVDDFGIGYSSLGYLKRLPVDELKIDREFVKDMVTTADAAIAKTVIDLGHNLGLRVVAEGVEDRETLERLASLGCDQAQGYFISRPIPAAELAAWASASAKPMPVTSAA
jgi:diguanylate cyclase (GGDEF)-like protein